MRRYIFQIFFYLLSTSLAAQIFQGNISNEDGEPIPFATLYIKEISYGFITDNSGHFKTTLTPGSYTCEVSSLGYSQEIIALHIPQEGLIRNITLKEIVYELQEVQITKNNEDPAYAVMRNAVAYAPKYISYVKNYQAETYLKGTGKVSKIPGILLLSKEVREETKDLLGRTFLLEEQRTVKYTAPDKWENEVHAYTNSFPDNIRISLQTTDINLYQPRLFGKISPLSPGSFTLYEFKLEGCYTEGEHIVNKIQVVPKKNSPELVTGFLYIIEDLWCLSMVDLVITDQGLTANFQVTCKEVKPSVFLATSIGVTCVIDLLGMKAEASYLSAIKYHDVIINETNHIGINFFSNDTINSSKELSKQQQKILEKIEELQFKENFSTRDAYKMSRLITKSIQKADTVKPAHKYERKPRIYDTKTDSLAAERDSVYWAKIRTVPLRPEEIESYAYREKLNYLRDSLGNDSIKSLPREIWRTFWLGKTFQSKDKKNGSGYMIFQPTYPNIIS